MQLYAALERFRLRSGMRPEPVKAAAQNIVGTRLTADVFVAGTAYNFLNVFRNYPDHLSWRGTLSASGIHRLACESVEVADAVTAILTSRLAFWLWISAWSLVVGLWAPVAAPAYAVHGLHISFIGGFGLMTLMIAARVTLAHGGYPAGLEVRLRAFPWIAGFALLAAFTRAAAFVDPRIYLHHLGYAAVAWVGAALLWLKAFGPRIVHLQEEA